MTLLKVTFNRAFIISFLWHLFCFFAVTIIIVPVGIKPQGSSEVSFIGSILDEHSFYREFRNLHLRSDSSSPALNKFLFPDNEKIASRRLERYSDAEHFLKVKPYKVSIDEILEVEKILPAGISKGPLLKSADRDFEIEGEARERTVLLKPPFPVYQSLLSKTQEDIIGEYCKVRLKIVITPEGRVKSVEKLASSGSPEIDLMAIRYVKKWSFAPLKPDQPQNNQEGILLLTLKAE